MILMGHRGAKDEKPENTMQGFQHAVKLSLKAVELDIHLSSDERLMVIHDSTLDRTTNGNGLISAHTFTQLRSLDAGAGQKIPFLQEVLDYLLSKGVHVQIEIKDKKTLPALNKLIKAMEVQHQEQVTIISFHHRWLKDLRFNHKNLDIAGLIYAYPLEPQEIAKSIEAQGLSFNTQFIDEQLVAKCRKYNLKITGWNANTKDEYLRLKALEIDFLGTDVPTQCLAWD
jgi:glycerophosphoryl diester phosphodiesterase